MKHSFWWGYAIGQLVGTVVHVVVGGIARRRGDAR